jgi:hypothetical protein
MKTWLKRQFSTVESARHAVLTVALTLGALGFVIVMTALIVG